MTTMNDDDLKVFLEDSRKKISDTRCSECGCKLKPIFKATTDPLDWLFRECDTCEEAVCPKCSDVDDAGVCQCYTCYELTLHQPESK